jgi:2-iminoacetate synthase ThiH
MRIAAILDKALAGESLSPEEGYRLIHCEDSEVDAVIEAAGQMRDRSKGRVVTYSRKVFLPVTNLCRDRCSYCTFRKDPTDPDEWTMTPTDIRHTLDLGSAQGCKEALMCLGDKPEVAYPHYRETLASFGHQTTAAYVAEACEMAAERGFLPHTNAGVLSYEEMKLLKPVNASLGLMLETVSMAEFSEPDALEIARTVATGRLLLGGDMNIQVPPNLNPDEHRLLLRAGINDWGGISPVTEDYVNPEAAWPHIETLAETCREEGFILCERLAIYDEYIERPGFLPPLLGPIVSELQAAIA